jgi:hypothetical protein
MKSISLHTNKDHSKHEKYRENWEFLQRAVAAEPVADPEPGQIDDIQGCAGEFPAEPAQPIPPYAYTKVPSLALDDSHAGNFFGSLFRRVISSQRISY